MYYRWIVVTLLFVLLSCGSTSQDNQTINLWLDEPAHIQAKAIQAHTLTSAELVSGYLSRIATLDTQVNSVLSLNGNALEQAREIDKRIAAGEKIGPLAGVPVLLKDNIESSELPTTAGSLALVNNHTLRDAPIVAKLKAAGAIILGKTNLSEWANFRSESSISGWSAVGGLTRNPHMLSRSACGSSSGSGAAMALRLASLSVGTETNGSIICPSAYNGIVGFKPTVGLLSRTHIVPISFSQDTAGPMTTNVLDAWLMTQIMAGADVSDKATIDADNHIPDKALIGKVAPNLSQLRIGVMRYGQGSNQEVIAMFDQALSTLKEAGATLVEIHEMNQPDDFWTHSYNLLLSEFYPSINAYLASSPAQIPVRNLNDLIRFNEETEAELALFDQIVFRKSLDSAPIESDDYKMAFNTLQLATTAQGIDHALEQNQLDVLVAPSNNPAFMIDGVFGDYAPGGFAGIGYMAAIAGYPHLTVPSGQVRGLPVGLSFIGGKWDDAKVLDIGLAFERQHRFFVRPTLLPSRLDSPELHMAVYGVH